MSGHDVRGVVCTWSTFDDHVEGLQTESPKFNPQRRSCLLPDELKRFVVADDCESRRSLGEPVEMFPRPDYSQRFALGLTVSCFDIGQSSASVYDHAAFLDQQCGYTISLCISKYAVVAESSRLYFTLWHTDASFSPHLRSEVCFVRSRNGSVRVAKFFL